MKSEPESYSWQDLVRDGATEWDGVRNNAARLHLRAMQPGDEAFFYHSMSDKAVVGIMRVTRAAEPDPKAPDWVRVRVEPVRALERPVTLAKIKTEPPIAALGRAGARRGVEAHPRDCGRIGTLLVTRNESAWRRFNPLGAGPPGSRRPSMP
jgi:predicted RNA-binding protein with PUA-like domain